MVQGWPKPGIHRWLQSAAALLSCAAGVFAGEPGKPVSPSSAGIPCRYEVTLIQAPGDCSPLPQSTVTVRGLNELGQVCGSYRPCALGDNRPFIWSAEDGFQSIPLPPGIESGGFNDINDHGVCVGTWARTAVGFRGFVYDHGVWTELPPPFPQGACSAQAISNNSVVCGRRSVGSVEYPQNAFTWSPQSGFVDLGVVLGPNSVATDLTADGQVVGFCGSTISGDLNNLGVVWTNGRPEVFAPIPGGVSSAITCIAIDSVMAGSGGVAVPGGMSVHGFKYENQQFSVILPLAGYQYSPAVGANDHGVVVGQCSKLFNPNDRRGYVWQDNLTMDLNALVPSSQQITVQTALGINQAGNIIAVVRTISGNVVGAMLSPVNSPIADLNCDTSVNGIDLGILLAAWGRIEGVAQPSVDLNRDGTVNGIGLGILLAYWSAAS